MLCCVSKIHSKVQLPQHFFFSFCRWKHFEFGRIKISLCRNAQRKFTKGICHILFIRKENMTKDISEQKYLKKSEILQQRKKCEIKADNLGCCRILDSHCLSSSQTQAAASLDLFPTPSCPHVQLHVLT